ncbi:MAG TPA: SDR family oxidoreductase [Devosia sp.]|nr:SDR family oxidoreductase [Devosia sp.]
MNGRFFQQTALVTGGASGIGASIAQMLAAGGAKVVVADRDRPGAEDVVARITNSGGTAVAFEVNVANAIEVEAMVEFAVRTYGSLHLAVNNAGIGGPSAATADYPLEGWQNVIDVNLNSAFYGLKYEIPAILASGGGAIVNMASILGTLGFAQACAYVSAKHAMVGLTKTAAIEYARHGVRINAVGPGFIDTPLLSHNLDAAALTYITGLHPIGRLGTAEEVAALTCFLLSQEAAFITGSYHLVDGGYAAQ